MPSLRRGLNAYFALRIARLLKSWRDVGSVDIPEAPMNLSETLNRWLGISPVLKGKRLFAPQPFRMHSPEAIGEVFTAGGASTTPKLDEIATDSIKIWVFLQIGFIGTVSFAILCYLIYHFHNPKLLPALIIIGAFAIPFSCLIFFWEINAPKNINIFTMLFLVLVGGILGIANSLFLFESTHLGATWLSASSAGIIEETGKLAAVVILMGRKRKYPWILNGLLFGAAAGTGFAAFESAGYAFESNSLESAIAVTILRGVLSPFCHVIWTAATSAALWKAMGGHEFSAAALKNPKFLKVFLAVMSLHMLWNSPLDLFPVIGIGDADIVDAKFVLLGWAGWSIILGLVREGYYEIKQAQRALPPPAYEASLVVAGEGFRDVYSLRRGRVTIGREKGNDIVLGHPSISRRHARIERADEAYTLVDLGSAHGTYLNGSKVTTARLRHRDRIDLCGIELVFELAAPVSNPRGD
jgi:RsiW-degrading membrane proteinase PrsW (M82 family)